MTKETIKIINQKRRCKKYQTLEQRLCKTLHEFLCNECHFTPGTQIGGEISNGWLDENHVEFYGWDDCDNAYLLFSGKQDGDIRFSYKQVILSKRNRYCYKWNIDVLNKITVETKESVKEIHPALALRRMAMFKDNNLANKFYNLYVDLFGCGVQ